MENKEIGAEEIVLAPETTSEVIEIVNETISEVAMTEDIPVLIEEEPKKKVRVSEIRELRGENSKVFRMSDGTEQAVFYPEAVHVFDEETQGFEEVDDTLTEEEDGRHFVSGKNRFTARFSREEENDELFAIEHGAHRVTVSAKKNNKQKNKGVRPRIHAREKANGRKADLLAFEDIQSGTDYEYSVMGSGVKENIVVKEKADVYRYPFILHCENVTAQLDEQNNRIGFISNKTQEEVFFIPTPFMSDASGIISAAVSYEMKPAANGDVLLTVTADSDWMNAEDRVFPVVIDPQIRLSGTSGMTTYSWKDGVITSDSFHVVGTTGNSDGTCNANRMYMNFNMPTLPRNPRIKKAELTFSQHDGRSRCGDCSKLGLYLVTGNISTGTCTPANDEALIDFARMKKGHCEGEEEQKVISYTFDITTLLDQVSKGEIQKKSLMLKMLDEMNDGWGNVTLYGANYSTYAPTLTVTYESSYGVNTSYRTHTHEIGRFGQGSIDLQCGNLMFESEDFAWAGNRMPVTIKHLYNSALADYQYTANSAIKLSTANFSAMKVGNGWKLNLMQSVMAASFQHEGVAYSGYVHIGENGEETYFKQSEDHICCGSNGQCYKLYENVAGGDVLYDPVEHTLTQGDTIYLFNTSGRLIKITDAFGNHMDITYTTDRITSVTDGAGREFGFAYNSKGFLTSITAPDGTSILYSYSGNLLSGITYQEGKKVSITYTSNKPTAIVLQDADSNNVYKVAYAFSGDRVASVTEYGVENKTFVIGAKSTYSYSVASGRTVVSTTEQADEGETASNVVKTVYTFDDDGNIISQYAYSEDTGNVSVGDGASGINPYAGDGGAGVVSNINNLLQNHNFESLNHWTAMAGNDAELKISNYAYEPYTKYGKKILRMQSYNQECAKNGVYQITNVLPAGQYTFSVYVRTLSNFIGTDKPGAYIRVTTAKGTVLAESEHIASYESEYIRLIAPFELTSAQIVQVQILLDGKGTIYADAAQLENNPYANAYNMLENGNFENGVSGWNTYNASHTTDTCFNMSGALMMNGDVEAARYACQNVTVRTNRTTRETFTLSGWAKGYGLPNHERDGVATPQFRLRAVVRYYDTVYKEYGSEEFTADFSPCTEEWQFASVQFAKSKYRTVNNISVYCDYGYNSGVVYFDDIQLVRNSFETYLSASDFAVESTDASDVSENVGEIEEIEDTAPIFDEAKDKFGNALTETTFTDGEFGTIYRSFGFTPDCNCVENAGNDLVCETDTRGNQTLYIVNEDTSRNEEATDRCGNKTAYEYDKAGRTTKVISKKADGTPIANVSYAYDAFDNMTEIARGDGLKYVLKYNAYHNLESIGVNGKSEKLATYTYKNGNGRLKEVEYANGDTMKVIYNSIGQVAAEKWYDNTAALIAHYKYVYDGQGNIVRSVDITGEKEYIYYYEEGILRRSVQCSVVLDADERITQRNLENSIIYAYDSEGKLTKKRVIPVSGSEQTVYYENTDNNTVVKFVVGDRTVTSHSKTDSFGRKVFDELQLGTGFVSRQFTYHEGVETQQHKDNAKLKSTATTQLVKQIVLSGGRTLSYEYDAEERITKVVDSVDGITEYTYDAQGQLLAETVNGTVVNTMTYDNYGNIRTKNGVAYTYGDDKWKDLLTAYNGTAITYDDQGNPLTYRGYTFTWKKGRQLQKAVGNGKTLTYTYNANGIRTSKTVNGVVHNYLLEGTKILQEIYGTTTLCYLYDNEDSVCGLTYNGTPYYFQKNLQGDVIGIVNADAKVVARYTYDAWGVCTVAKDESGCKIADINPFRYRGYYMDVETGMYYLQSRYYDVEVGRFVNVDDAVCIKGSGTVIGNNLFSYCENNPVNNVDLAGNLGIKSLLSAVDTALGFIISIAETAIFDSKPYKNLTKNIKAAKTRSARKDLIKKQRKLVISGTGKGLYFVAKVIGFIALVAPYIQYVVDWGKDKLLFVELLVSIIVEGISCLLCKLASKLISLIPSIGILLGFAGSFLLGKLLSSYFSDKRIAKIAQYFNNRLPQLKSVDKWIKTFIKALTI